MAITLGLCTNQSHKPKWLGEIKDDSRVYYWKIISYKLYNNNFVKVKLAAKTKLLNHIIILAIRYELLKTFMLLSSEKTKCQPDRSIGK